MANTPTKVNHYVPICYLKNFTNDEGILHVYNKRNSKIYSVRIFNYGKNRRTGGSSSVGCEKYLYSLDLEDFFAKQIEPLINSFYKYIKENQQLPDKQSEIFKGFLKYLNYQIVRTKINYEVENQRQIERYRKTFTERSQKITTVKEETKRQAIDMAVSFIEKKKIVKEVWNDGFLQYRQFIENINGYNYTQWKLLTTHDYFITSDNPVIVDCHSKTYLPGIFQLDENRIRLSDIKFPLSSKYAITGESFIKSEYNISLQQILEYIERHADSKILDPILTKQFNEIIFNNSKEVYSIDKYFIN